MPLATLATGIYFRQFIIHSGNKRKNTPVILFFAFRENRGDDQPPLRGK